ncbi:MAG: peptide ABC transporter substrate-binding protein [Anaerolineae bacterium]|nr:peptide ABC transporter substrate-binding protein [Anaerolineae bacterium]
MALVVLLCLGSLCLSGLCGAAALFVGRPLWEGTLHLPFIPTAELPVPPIGIERATPTPPHLSRTGVLRLVAAPPETMDPALAGDLDSAQFVTKVFGGLVSLDEDLEVQPDLAEGWELSEDGRTYTFRLREDARFHDGRPITAEDVRYSLERACDPALGSRLAGAYLGDIGGVQERLRGQADTIAGVEVLDERTLRITIDAPKSYFLSKLTYSTAFVVDRQQVERDPNWLEHPNGSGPFRLAEWTEDRIVLEPSPYYPGLQTGVEKIVFYTAPRGVPVTMYENGELDAAPVGGDQLERVLDPTNPLHQELQVVPLLDTFYVGLNLRTPPFDDLKVRRAFAMALNREGIVQVLLRGQAEVARGILPPGMPGYNPDLQGIPYDPEGARELLAQSRYGGPEGLPPITLTVGGSGSMGEALAEMWAENLGVDVQVEVPVGGLSAEWQAGRLQMVLLGWIADYPDPENFLDILFHSQSPQNHTGYHNPEVDRLLEEARAEPAPEKRYALYREAEERIVADVPWIPLYHDTAHLLVKPYVEGLRMTAQGLYDLRQVRLLGP